MKFALLGVGAVCTVMGLGLVGWSLAGGVSGKGQLDLKLSHRPTVMTIAYKAYGNPQAVGGKYWLSKAVLQNTGNAPLRNVKLSYQVPDYMTSWSTPDEASELLPGQSAVFLYYPRLPKSVTEIRSKTPAELQVKIEYDDGSGVQSRVEKRPFEFRGVTEIEYTSLPGDEIVSWYDVFDNNEVLAAYVADEDPVIAAYYAKVMEAAGGIPPLSNGETLQKFMKSVYDYMVSCGMNYSAAKGVPEQMNNVSSLVQSIRLPREVVQNNTGLCIELALLWASIGNKAGAKSYVLLKPGHAFTILQSDDGTRIPIECTMIGGGGGQNMGAAGSFEEAVAAAAKQLQEIQQTGMPYFLIDVNAMHQQGVRPPELPTVDVEAFKKQLDNTRQTWLAKHQGGGQQQTQLVDNRQQQQDQNQQQIRPQPLPDRRGNDGGGPVAGMVAWASPDGRCSLSYPQNWQQNPMVVQQFQQMFPGYVFNAASPMTGCGVDVVFYDGYQSVDQVVQDTIGAFQAMGVMVNVAPPQPAQVGGKQAMSVSLAFQTQQGMGAATMFIAQTREGFVSINIGGPQAGLAAAMPELQKVLTTVKIR
jgi:hypothetical protein